MSRKIKVKSEKNSSKSEMFDAMLEKLKDIERDLSHFERDSDSGSPEQGKKTNEDEEDAEQKLDQKTLKVEANFGEDSSLVRRSIFRGNRDEITDLRQRITRLPARRRHLDSSDRFMQRSNSASRNSPLDSNQRNSHKSTSDYHNVSNLKNCEDVIPHSSHSTHSDYRRSSQPSRRYERLSRSPETSRSMDSRRPKHLIRRVVNQSPEVSHKHHGSSRSRDRYDRSHRSASPKYRELDRRQNASKFRSRDGSNQQNEGRASNYDYRNYHSRSTLERRRDFDVSRSSFSKYNHGHQSPEKSVKINNMRRSQSRDSLILNQRHVSESEANRSRGRLRLRHDDFRSRIRNAKNERRLYHSPESRQNCRSGSPKTSIASTLFSKNRSRDKSERSPKCRDRSNDEKSHDSDKSFKRTSTSPKRFNWVESESAIVCSDLNEHQYKKVLLDDKDEIGIEIPSGEIATSKPDDRDDDQSSVASETECFSPLAAEVFVESYDKTISKLKAEQNASMQGDHKLPVIDHALRAYPGVRKIKHRARSLPPDMLFDMEHKKRRKYSVSVFPSKTPDSFTKDLQLHKMASKRYCSEKTSAQRSRSLSPTVPNRLILVDSGNTTFTSSARSLNSEKLLSIDSSSTIPVTTQCAYQSRHLELKDSNSEKKKLRRCVSLSSISFKSSDFNSQSTIIFDLKSLARSTSTFNLNCSQHFDTPVKSMKKASDHDCSAVDDSCSPLGLSHPAHASNVSRSTKSAAPVTSTRVKTEKSASFSSPRLDNSKSKNKTVPKAIKRSSTSKRASKNAGFSKKLKLDEALTTSTTRRIQSKESQTTFTSETDRNASNLIVKNLSTAIDTKTLGRIFSRFGRVISPKVAIDEDGQHMGFGYIRFEEVESAENAIQKYNGLYLDGKRISVEKFIPKSVRLNSKGGFGKDQRNRIKARKDESDRTAAKKSEENSILELVYKCTPEVAKFIQQSYSKSTKSFLNVHLTEADDGVKMLGRSKDINQAILSVDSKHFQTEQVTFVAPKLLDEFKKKDWFSLMEKLRKHGCMMDIITFPSLNFHCNLLFEVKEGSLLETIFPSGHRVARLHEDCDAIIRICREQIHESEDKTEKTDTEEKRNESAEATVVIGSTEEDLKISYEGVCDHVFGITAPTADSLVTLEKEVKNKLEKARELGSRSVAIVPYDPNELTTLPVRRVSEALQKALTDFYNDQVDLIRKGTTNNFISVIRIVLIRKPELIPIFQKFAMPDSESCQLCGDFLEKVSVSVTDYKTAEIEKVIEKIKSFKSKLICKYEVKNENLIRLEKDEVEDIYCLTSKAGVSCYIEQKSHLRILLSGLRSNVEQVKPKVKDLLQKVEDASTFTKHCTWMWEVEPNKFDRLPVLVAAILEKQKEETVPSSLLVNIRGEKVHIDVGLKHYQVVDKQKTGKIGRKSHNRVSDEAKLMKASAMGTLVVLKPKLGEEKLRYLESLLHGKCGNYASEKINRLLQEKNLKGQIALLKSNVSLVTTSIENYSECCEFFERNVHLSEIDTYIGTKASGLSKTSTTLLIKELGSKWLGFECRDNSIVVGSFIKDDVTKSSIVIREQARKFLDSAMHECDRENAVFIVKHYSDVYSNVEFEIVDDGLKVVGAKTKLEEVSRFLEEMEYFEDEVKFVAPNLGYYFSNENWVEVFKKILETNFKSLVQIAEDDESASESECESPNAKEQIVYEVAQGDLVNETTNAIVNGVSSNFSLNWGKISPVVLAHAGDEILTECSSNPTISTYLKVTKGYKLSCKHVFHLVTPDSCDELTTRVKIALEEAQNLGLESISFPTLGAGGKGLDASDVADSMFQAFDEFKTHYSDRSTSLKKIRVVVFDPNIVNVFKIFTPSSPPPAITVTTERDTFGVNEEHWTVTVMTNEKKHLEQIVAMLNERQTVLTKEKIIIDQLILKMEKHDLDEIEKLALNNNVQCVLKSGSSELSIRGVDSDVIGMTKAVNDLLKELNEALVLAKVSKWMWKEQPQIWTPLPLRVSKAITSLQKKSVITSQIEICGEEFAIDFSSTTLISTKDQKVFKIIEKEVDLPAEWSPMHGKSFLIDVVGAQTLEYQNVAKRFQDSAGGGYNIIKIERVQNPVLYNQYQIQKKDIKSHMQSNGPVERELFHGTSQDDACKICAHGFDRGFAGKNATAYGRGTYFAVDASYSVTFTNENYSGARCMFLAQVLTGNYCQGDSGMKAAPALSGSDRLFDSVVNNVSSPSMFIVFRDASVYPKYLITFN